MPRLRHWRSKSEHQSSTFSPRLVSTVLRLILTWELLSSRRTPVKWSLRFQVSVELTMGRLRVQGDKAG